MFTCNLCGGLGDGEIGLSHTHRATTHLAHKKSFLWLFVCFPFLSACVICFKFKTRQHCQKAKIVSQISGPKLPLESPISWQSRELPRRHEEAAGPEKGVGQTQSCGREVTTRLFSLSQFIGRVNVLFKVEPLSDSLVLGREQG